MTAIIHPAIGRCPVCGDTEMVRLIGYETGIPIVGCGNPWHYATASLGDPPPVAQAARDATERADGLAKHLPILRSVIETAIRSVPKGQMPSRALVAADEWLAALAPVQPQEKPQASSNPRQPRICDACGQWVRS